MLGEPKVQDACPACGETWGIPLSAMVETSHSTSRVHRRSAGASVLGCAKCGVRYCVAPGRAAWRAPTFGGLASAPAPAAVPVPKPRELERERPPWPELHDDMRHREPRV